MCTENFLHADEMGRILNGAEVVPNSWNWYAYFGTCGGTILSSEWILTAAHCGIQVGSQVALGYHDNLEADPVQIVEVLEVIEHESYQKPIRDSNDVALVRVNPINFDGKTVNPACIQKDIDMFEGKRCYVGGMGYLYSADEYDPQQQDFPGTPTENVQSTSVVIGGGDCGKEQFSYHQNYPEILCAGDNSNQVIQNQLLFLDFKGRK